MRKRLGSIICLIVLCSASLGALPGAGPVEERWWYMLERGKRLYREGDMGDALLVFEDAIKLRRDYFSRLETSLIAALSLPEIRILGDDLTLVQEELRKRSLVDALRAVEETWRQVRNGSLDNSVSSLLSHLKKLSHYPEAEFWAGRVLAAEGEFSIALKRYLSALEKGQGLQTKEERRSVNYALAALYQAMGNHTAEEETLLGILQEDEQYKTFSEPFIHESLVRNAQDPKGLDHLLTIYRYQAPEFHEAHERLSSLYIQLRSWDRAWDHALYAFLISSTTLIQELSWSNSAWTWSSLDEAIQRVYTDYKLSDFLDASSWHRGLYYLATSAWFSQKRDCAQWVWRFLSQDRQAGEWQERARRQLVEVFEDL